MLPTKPYALATHIGKLLQTKSLILATAESCTGGWASQIITSVAGSSKWFDRGFVTYTNQAKEEMLGVTLETLKNYGAVSQETACEMAEGAIKHSYANVALAITGIAGPGGGAPQKPVGTVWVAWTIKQKGQLYTASSHYLFEGKRSDVRKNAVTQALTGLLALLGEDFERTCNNQITRQKDSAFKPSLLGEDFERTCNNQITRQNGFKPPVITMDGPSGTGKGTLTHRLAKYLKWHYLDSGALFRALAHQILQKKITFDNELDLSNLAKNLDVEFIENDYRAPTILLEGIDITLATRTEECGNTASKIATLPHVREALLQKQRTFRRWPGLVTDGRDMGTVVFPDATLKFYLNASPEERAKRRYKQLKKRGLHASLDKILQQLMVRDERDKTRSIAPLAAAPDAILIDTTELDVERSFKKILEHVKKIIYKTGVVF